MGTTIEEKFLGREDVGTKDSTTIENVLYVEGLKHSLLTWILCV